ncbi:MAG: dihydrofolate reductase family protein [Candidatus Dadabacteria bacterium]
MRKIVSGFASSVDGYIEGPNGEYDWILINKEMDFQEQMKRYDTFLYGRLTYERTLTMKGALARGARHYVFSHTLEEVENPFKLIKGDFKEKILHMKQQPGKDIAVFGGAILLASLLDIQLVDELSIAVIPVLLGSGKPMVDILNSRIPLNLRETKTYSNGTVQLTYDIAYP